MIPFPDIDPVALQLGPFAIRWYALAYVAGFLAGWWVIARLVRPTNTPLTLRQLDDFITWGIVGVLLGGRLGYVLFYNLPYYLEHPGEILMVWHGGMAFHGGFAGFLLVSLLFCRKHTLPYLQVMDLTAVASPIGLFFGRIANFINGELFGRVTDVPWGIVFPNGGTEPRHPSQLYEAGLEGPLLFILLFFLATRTNIRSKPGWLCGIFMIGYGISRIFVECFREPDAQLGFIFSGITMGQILSLPMVAIGVYLLVRDTKKMRTGTAP